MKRSRASLALTASFLALVATSEAIAAQSLQAGFRAGIGLESATAVVRARLLWERWGIFAGVGRRAVNQECTASIPALCDVPGSGATEFEGGLVFRARELPLYAALGGGVLSWNGTDPFWALELGTSVGVSEPLVLDVGIQVLSAPSVTRQSATQVVEADLTLFALVATLYVG